MIPAGDPYDFLIVLLKEQTGQVFSSSRHWRIEMVLKPILKKHSIPDISVLVSLLESGADTSLARDCVEAMINNETCFFRDQANFALLTGPVIDAVREKRQENKTIRIWSAACSSGQEAYSLAMAFSENGEKWRDWDVTIYASDVSRNVLNKAKLGRYSQFEVQRGLPVTMMLKYFTQEDEEWVVKDNLRKMTNFGIHNQLQSAAHLGKFDIILCRNMLMYLSDENRIVALDNLQNSLRSDGYVMLGAAETVIGNDKQFKASREFRGFYEPSGCEPSQSAVRLSA